MRKKRLITFALTLPLVFSVFYLPNLTPKTEAAIPTFDIEAIIRDVIDGFAMKTAQDSLNRVIEDTIDWAQTGFRGNPAYVTDTEQYFKDIADGVVGEFIAGSDLEFLCSPFKAQVKLGLQKIATEPARRFQCTLTDIGDNINNFYGDFTQGGWDTWFAMTQNNSNNPYGAFLTAKIEMDSRAAAAIGLKQSELEFNQGFLSWRDCIKENPPAGAEGHRAGTAVGACIEEGPVKTPGSVIATQLNEALPKGAESLVAVDDVSRLVNAFLSGITQRYVFSEEGLFRSQSARRDTTSTSAPALQDTPPTICEILSSVPGAAETDPRCVTAPVFDPNDIPDDFQIFINP